MEETLANQKHQVLTTQPSCWGEFRYIGRKNSSTKLHVFCDQRISRTKKSQPSATHVERTIFFFELKRSSNLYMVRFCSSREGEMIFYYYEYDYVVDKFAILENLRKSKHSRTLHVLGGDFRTKRRFHLPKCGRE